MKKQKMSKEGVSLIVLVLTIVIMIILGGVIILNLSNSGIIDKANDTVEETNLAEMNELASVGWALSYGKGARTTTALEAGVIAYMQSSGISQEEMDQYAIVVTTKGVKVGDKSTSLGYMITAADYGKTVDYSANGVTDWKIFYHTDSYVYLIATEPLAAGKIPTDIPGATVNGNKIYWATEPASAASGTINSSLWMANWEDYTAYGNGKCISYLLDESYWTAFKNTTYGSDVIGAIGTPTMEMFEASWEAKSAALNSTSYLPLTLTKGTYGYYVNDSHSTGVGYNDSLYFTTDSYWLASPSYYDGLHILATNPPSNPGIRSNPYTIQTRVIRPVVCLSAAIQAEVGTTTDFVLK